MLYKLIVSCVETIMGIGNFCHAVCMAVPTDVSMPRPIPLANNLHGDLLVLNQHGDQKRQSCGLCSYAQFCAMFHLQLRTEMILKLYAVAEQIMNKENKKFQDDVIASPNLHASRKRPYISPDGERPFRERRKRLLFMAIMVGESLSAPVRKHRANVVLYNVKPIEALERESHPLRNKRAASSSSCPQCYDDIGGWRHRRSQSLALTHQERTSSIFSGQKKFTLIS
ncbi:hypothetical protein GHT06_010200 [Daphnia sinensis]|uniref:Uncharacterized protein n=1 Tax=Daphnia sinensis TaxID=1820382 RepID=A0AAD5KY13_9CRUS|nr:hypothetical protein GHT06_010200 [Daphnia sinensis]